jgi:hypothetical protein
MGRSDMHGCDIGNDAAKVLRKRVLQIHFAARLPNVQTEVCRLPRAVTHDEREAGALLSCREHLPSKPSGTRRPQPDQRHSDLDQQEEYEESSGRDRLCRPRFSESLRGYLRSYALTSG